MTGLPVDIYIDDDVQTKVVHTPASIPIHWQEEVKADLYRDEAPQGFLSSGDGYNCLFIFSDFECKELCFDHIQFFMIKK